ncbi:hypothetical protein [Bradyrhizobium sp. CW11]|uniref:hypothetical protein n=1 Tax=Bradyrhizobium sp. CW11 TaxID=2782684 RepID=UPI001FFB2CBE|nr:hypothetical protein [Bradyrhizobium sp. CW11]MCK1346042.1 hypothetical protein [Bradyrhizobium sp. CW11]
MTRIVDLEDWAMEVATTIYRVCLYRRVFGQFPPNTHYVTAGELAETQTKLRDLNDAEFARAIEDAQDAAWEVYQRVYRRHSTPPPSSQIN